MSKKFIVYFEQVNQQAIEVKADSKDEARQKAMSKWKENIYPDYEIVEVFGEEAFALPPKPAEKEAKK